MRRKPPACTQGSHTPLQTHTASCVPTEIRLGMSGQVLSSGVNLWTNSLREVREALKVTGPLRTRAACIQPSVESCLLSIP